MLSVMSSNNHWILSLKLMLVSSAVLSMAVVLKFSVPVVADVLVSDVPAVWSSIGLWLKPPYLYLLVNFIIISILASLKLDHHDLVDPPPSVPLVVSAPAAKLSVDSRADDTARRAVGDVLNTSACDANENFAADVSEKDVKVDVEFESKVLERENDENGEKDRSGLQKEDSIERLFFKYEKKPPVSLKAGHRKAAKATPAGKSLLRGPHMKGHDTLDNTWKTITDGCSAPPSRRLDKSDTWDSHGGRDEAVGRSSPTKVKKSETFDERRSGGGGGKSWDLRQSARVRKKPSLTEEELNRQVEAFIEKFKEEMRLQREESLKNFQKMISQGT